MSKCKNCKFSYHNGGNKCPIEIHRDADACTYNEEIPPWKVKPKS